MNVTPVLIAVVLLIVLLVTGVLLYLLLSGNAASRNKQAMSGITSEKPQRTKSVFESAANTGAAKKVQRSLSLERRLRFARWSISPVVFRVMEIAISLFALSLVSIRFGVPFKIASLLAGPIVMGAALNFSLQRRFKAFDADYAPFLLSLTGLLKTGMNTMTALEAAAQGLAEGSLVREEVELMIERTRFGVPEEKSIGAFGEDIMHPEIELFVQALLLSRRVGGVLSETLERLAKQVRKRQFFRASAQAAVSMQRGSIWFIIVILLALEGYLYVTYPESITEAWKHETAFLVWQCCVLLIGVGIYWVRKVTEIKT